MVRACSVTSSPTTPLPRVAAPHVRAVDVSQHQRQTVQLIFQRVFRFTNRLFYLGVPCAQFVQALALIERVQTVEMFVCPELLERLSAHLSSGRVGCDEAVSRSRATSLS